ncbi:MAG: dipeptidase [Fidelibacterota bacterium]
MKKLFILTAVAFLAGCSKMESPDEISKFHQSAVVVDAHTDVLLPVMAGVDIGIRRDEGHVDLPRMKEGGMDVQVFAVWVDPKRYGPGRAFKRASGMIDAMEEIVKKYGDVIELAESPSDIEAILKENKIAAMLGVEGGHAIENSLEKLEQFYRRGVRYLTLTWNNSTQWATSAYDEESDNPPERSGLSEFGREIVSKMNDLGMMIDVSHLGEKTFWDVIQASRAPVIASHSSVYAICPTFRNLKDEQIIAMARKGGVVFINFYSGYLDSTFERKRDAIFEAKRARLDSLKVLFPDKRSLEYYRARAALMKPDMEKIRPPLDILIDHIDYIVKLVGADYVGFGSDFEGMSSSPVGIEDVSKMPNITRKLFERGYSREDVRKILGLNFLRVYKKVYELRSKGAD